MFLKESTNFVFTLCKELLSLSEISYTKKTLNERPSIHNSTQKSITARTTSPQ